MRTPEKPIISIVVPCLNRADFLIPTIESVLQQEYPNIECIVIDGGSTDGTIELLKRYDGRIKWISESDSGHADAINKGWKMSKGEILVWLNADDIWAPQAVNNAVTYLEKHPEVDVVYGSSAIIDKDGNIINLDKPLEWNFDAAVKYCYYFIPQSSSFIRRRILEKIGWFDDIIGTFINKTGKDRWLWLRIALAGGIIKNIPNMLSYSRCHLTDSLSFDGQTVALACVGIIEKFYSLPNIPERFIEIRKRAMSNAYFTGMKYLWEGRNHDYLLLLRFILRGIREDPSNVFRITFGFMFYVIKYEFYRRGYRWTKFIVNTPLGSISKHFPTY